MAGGTPVELNRFVIRAVGATEPAGRACDVRVTARDLGEIVIDRQQLWKFGLAHEATGDVIFTAGAGQLTVSNIGSSGKDGVSIELPDTESATFELAPLDPTTLDPSAAEFGIEAFATVSGQPDQAIGRAEWLMSGGVMFLAADYQPWSPSYALEVSLDGVLVAQYSGLVGSEFSISDAPSSITADAPGFTMTWASPIEFSSGGSIVVGDSARLLLDAPSLPTIDSLSACALSAAGLDAFTVVGESTATEPQPTLFVRADANDDGVVNIGDAIYLINYNFTGGPAPHCLASGDANSDDVVDLGDIIYIISWQFTGGSEPAAPFPNCGTTSTPLPCASFLNCP